MNLISPAEAAVLLEINPRRLRRLAAEYSVGTVVSGRRAYNRADIERFRKILAQQPAVTAKRRSAAGKLGGRPPKGE